MSINTNFNHQYSTSSTINGYSSANQLTATPIKETNKRINNSNLLQQEDTISISNEAKIMQLSANATAKSSSWLDTANNWISSTTSWLKKAGQFALDAAKAGLDFLVLDDIKTIFNPSAGVTEKGVA